MIKIIKPLFQGCVVKPAILKTINEQLNEFPIQDGPLKDYRVVSFKDGLKDNHKLWKLKHFCDIVRIDNSTYYAKFHDTKEIKDILFCANLLEKYNSDKNIFKTINVLDENGVFIPEKNQRMKINKTLVGYNKNSKSYFNLKNLIDACVVYKEGSDFYLNDLFIKKGKENE